MSAFGGNTFSVGAGAKKSVTFSERCKVHRAHTSAEYDRKWGGFSNSSAPASFGSSTTSGFGSNAASPTQSFRSSSAPPSQQWLYESAGSAQSMQRSSSAPASLGGSTTSGFGAFGSSTLTSSPASFGSSTNSGFGAFGSSKVTSSAFDSFGGSKVCSSGTYSSGGYCQQSSWGTVQGAQGQRFPTQSQSFGGSFTQQLPVFAKQSFGMNAHQARLAAIDSTPLPNFGAFGQFGSQRSH